MLATVRRDKRMPYSGLSDGSDGLVRQRLAQHPLEHPCFFHFDHMG